MGKLTNKVAVVTGASKGIGAAGVAAGVPAHRRCSHVLNVIGLLSSRAEQFRLVNIDHSDRVTAPFFKLRNYASAVPQLDVVSVNELASLFEGVVVIRGDELMAARKMPIVPDTISAIFQLGVHCRSLRPARPTC